MTEIFFLSSRKDYGFLSNFWAASEYLPFFPPSIDTPHVMLFPTNEHYYQSQKARNPVDGLQIARELTPYGAWVAGRRLPPDRFNPEWDNIRVDVMLKGLRAKFTQNDDLKKNLFATDDAELHEASPNDLFWGVKGKDMLGKLLMQVRGELRPYG